MTKAALLLDERIIAVQPALIRVLGASEAIILQQLHFWLTRATCEHDGEMWVYKTYADWGDETGMSQKAVRGALDRLRKIDVVIAVQNPRDPHDRTRWWRIDYAALDIARGEGSSICPPGQVDQTSRADPCAPTDTSRAGVPDSLTESTTEEGEWWRAQDHASDITTDPRTLEAVAILRNAPRLQFGLDLLTVTAALNAYPKADHVKGAWLTVSKAADPTWNTTEAGAALRYGLRETEKEAQPSRGGPRRAVPAQKPDKPWAGAMRRDREERERAEREQQEREAS